jgi:hypothetical protein
MSYSYCVRKGLHPGWPFWLGGLVGALVPEMIHRTLTSSEIAEHSNV